MKKINKYKEKRRNKIFIKIRKIENRELGGCFLIVH
jgi:hypothetical protein